MTSKTQDADRGLRGYALHTRRHTQSPASHPHVHCNISIIVLIKKKLGVPDSGVPALLSYTHPTQTPPDSYTHMQKRRNTKMPMDTLTRTETTLRCLARVRTRPGAPVCYFLGSQSASAAPELGSWGRRPGYLHLLSLLRGAHPETGKASALAT